MAESAARREEARHVYFERLKRSMVPELYRRKLSKDEINALPMRRYEGEVRLVRTEEALENAVRDLRGERVLGFDTETKPSFRKGTTNAPALVQLAGEDVVYLVQLTWVPMNALLTSILSDPDIVKAGVSIHDDMRELRRSLDFEPAGLVDLGHAARACRMETQGLRNLAANLFGWRISKGPQCSNWGQAELSAKQVGYAATDAWIGRLVYLRMRELSMLPEPAAPPCGAVGI